MQRWSRQLAAAILWLLVSCAATVHGDSHYCLSHLSHPPPGSPSTNYSSCCGPSLEAYEYMLVAGSSEATARTGVRWSALQAGAIAPSYSACTYTERCCAAATPPTLLITPVNAAAGEQGTVKYGYRSPVRYELVRHANDTCVPLSGCCSASECDEWGGSLARGREWQCSAGTCMDVASACPYEPLNLLRIVFLFIIPGCVLLGELLLYFCCKRAWMLDCTFGAFGRLESLVQWGPLLLRPRLFRTLVLLHVSLPVGAHLWNAIDAPGDGCGGSGRNQWAEYILAMALVGVALVTAAVRLAQQQQQQSRSPSSPSGCFGEGKKGQVVWTDALVATSVVQLVPLIVVSALGPGHSALDYLILLQQGWSLRWLPLALLTAPWMCFVAPHAYTHSFVEYIYEHQWRGGVAYLELERQGRGEGAGAGTGLVGYRRRKVGGMAGAATASNKGPDQRSGAHEQGHDGDADFVTHQRLCGFDRLFVASGRPADDPMPPLASPLPPPSLPVMHVRVDPPSPLRPLRSPHPPPAASPPRRPTTPPSERAVERPIESIDPPPRRSVQPQHTDDDEMIEMISPSGETMRGGGAAHLPNFLNPSISSPQFFSALDTPGPAHEQAQMHRAASASHTPRRRTVASADAASSSSPVRLLATAEPPESMPRTPSPAHMANATASAAAAFFPSGGPQQRGGGHNARAVNLPPLPQPSPQARVFRKEMYDLHDEDEPLPDDTAASAAPSQPSSPVARWQLRVDSPTPPSGPLPHATDLPKAVDPRLERMRPPQLHIQSTPTHKVAAVQPHQPQPQPSPFDSVEAGLAPHGPFAGVSVYEPPPPMSPQQLFPQQQQEPPPAHAIVASISALDDLDAEDQHRWQAAPHLGPPLEFEPGLAPRTPRRTHDDEHLT